MKHKTSPKNFQTQAKEPVYVKFGEILRTCRLNQRISQVDLAQEVGISRPSLSNIEAGRQRVYLDQCFKFAVALNSPSIESLLPSLDDLNVYAYRVKMNPRILIWVRRTRGDTFSHAVKKLGVSPQTLKAYEHGGANPRRSFLKKVADKYGYTFLIFYMEKPPVMLFSQRCNYIKFLATVIKEYARKL